MKRPPNAVYWLDEVPPRGITILSAFQHVSLSCALLPVALVIARSAGLSPEATVDLVSASMLVLGFTVILQVLDRAQIGSGLLAPSSFSGAYIGPSIIALKTGGLPLMLGMTAFAGALETIFSRLLRRLRPFLPPEVAGFVVVLVGIAVGSFGVRYVLGGDTGKPPSVRELAVSAITIGTMIGFNVWGRGGPRLFCALLGMVGGYVAAALLGVLAPDDFERALAQPFFGLPGVATVGWSFEWALALPFTMAALAVCLKGVGDITTAHRLSDADWTRPDLAMISRGTLASGLGTLLAGLLGSTGQTTSSASIGLAGATGVTSRRIAYACGALFIALAFLPKFAALLAIMPAALMGAALMFVAAFIIVSGLQIVAARLLDVRRTFVIGLSLVVGLAIDISPAYFQSLPAAVQPLTSSSLVAGMILAIVLNLVFRIGVKNVQRLELPAGPIDPATLAEFIERCGASWGARRDVIERAKFNLLQSAEMLADSVAQGPLAIEASFDEFNVYVRMSYAGAPLALPVARPTDEEIMGSAEGERLLAGYMLRRFADRVTAVHRNGRATVTFAFIH